MTIEPIGEHESPMLCAMRVLGEAWGVELALAHCLTDEGVCSCALGAECESPAKHPIGARWQERATADPDELRRMADGVLRYNLAIVTGRIAVLDVDGPDGEASLAQYPELPLGPRVKTARGWHAYFRVPTGVVLRNRAGARGRGLGKGLDLRAEGGFVIVPPSVHASGVVYEWLPGCSPADLELPEVPAWIVERAADQPPPSAADASHGSEVRPVPASRAERWAEAAYYREINNVRAATKGERNNVLNTAAFNLAMIVAGGQLDGAEVKRALLGAAQVAGLSEFEAQKTIRSGFAAGLKKDQRTGPTRELASSYEPPGPSDEVPPPADDTAPRWPTLLGGKLLLTPKIFEPLGAPRWCVPGLQLGPGRPTLFVGFGASAKTFAAQSLALALAAGHGVWGHFECTPTIVLHLDFEQGEYATAKRYQRLALGHGIDWRELEGRLRFVALPKVYLDQKDARDHYMRACEGAELAIVDSLRGAAPYTDENDSAFRARVDLLTAVSEQQGCSQLVLHHAGKPKTDQRGAAPDARTLARGTGAIFDAAGCVFNFIARPGEGARLVQQVKMPAEAEGAALEAFELVLEDVTVDDVPNAGVRVLWRKPVIVDESTKAVEAFERDAAQILKAVRLRSSGSTANAIVARAGMGRGRALDVLRALADEGRLELSKGQRGSRIYRIPADAMVKP